MKSRVSQFKVEIPKSYIELTKLMCSSDIDLVAALFGRQRSDNLYDKSLENINNHDYPFIDRVRKELAKHGLDTDERAMGMMAGLFISANMLAEVQNEEHNLPKDYREKLDSMCSALRDVLVNSYNDGDFADEDKHLNEFIYSANETAMCNELFSLWYNAVSGMNYRDMVATAEYVGFFMYILYRAALLGRKEHRYIVGVLNMEAFDLGLYPGSILSPDFHHCLQAVGAMCKEDNRMIELGAIKSWSTEIYDPTKLPVFWHQFTKRQKVELLSGDSEKASVKVVNEISSDADKAYPIFKEGFTGGFYCAYNQLCMCKAHKEERVKAGNEQFVLTTTHDGRIKKLNDQIKAQDTVIQNRGKQIEELNAQIKDLKRKLYQAENRPAKIEYRDKTVDKIVEVPVPVDTKETAKLKALVEKQKARIANLESIKNAKGTQEQTIAKLTQRITDLEDYIEEVQKEEEPDVDASQLSDNEIALLQHIKAHISMPDCFAVQKISTLIPSAKIETRPFGLHDDIALTDGYDVYLFCTKLSHSQFSSWVNQVRKRGYNSAMVNTTGIVTICREIISAYSKVVNKK